MSADNWTQCPRCYTVNPEPPLKPGVCECGHRRCNHVAGKGKCSCAICKPDDKHTEYWGLCACQTFILDKEEDDDDDEEEPETPSPEELERMYQK